MIFHQMYGWIQDVTACNYDSDASSDDGSCLYLDCLGECGGSAVEDNCGNCEGDGASCVVNVMVSVDMSLSSVGDGNENFYRKWIYILPTGLKWKII